jgi:AraC-like DNA-binding protein
MESRVLREITPLDEHDFMYVADRHKKEFTYPIHQHDMFELNFVENAAGCRRVVGDSSEVIGDYDLVLITSPDLEHVWEQHECRSNDIHEVTIQFKFDFEREDSPLATNPLSSIRKMLIRAKKGLVFPMAAVMQVFPRITGLSQIKEGFYSTVELFIILYELSKFDNARELASSAFAKVRIESDSRRVLKVKNYIEAHYKEELRLGQLSDLVGMTPSAFSRFFKMRTGKSLKDYVVDVRLGYAARHLIDTTTSVAEVSYVCGFNTLSNFNRLFRKRKGCSPKEFREKYCKTKVII